MANVNFASGGQGPNRSFIAWFNFDGGDISSGSVRSYSNDIPGVGKITLDVSNSSPSEIQVRPGGGGGDLFGLGYTGVGGNPSMYMFSNNQGRPVGTVTIQNIKIVDLNNNPISYSLVTGDSETTVVTNEFLTWTTNGSAWTNSGFLSSGSPPYSSTFSGLGTQSVTSTLTNPGGASVSPMLFSKGGTSLTLRSEPHAGEGAGVGFLLSYATLTKAVDKSYASLNDTLTYTLVLTNKSISQISGTITDNLSPYVTFIPNSLTINGSASSSQPPTIAVSNIPSDGVATIVFKVLVTSLPPNNVVPNGSSFSGSGSDGNLSAVSNNVATTISFITSTIEKYVDETLVALTDIITYTLVIQNTGNIPMPSPTVIDTVPNGTRYVENSLTSATGSPNTTMVLDTIPVGAFQTITFKVQVVSVPCPNPIPNNASLSYTYKVDPTSSNTFTGGSNSNTVETLVGFADLTSKKYVDMDYSYLGSTITYTITITNNGVGSTKTTILYDTLPSQTTFIPNTYAINGVIRPNETVGTPAGSFVPTLMALETVTISFKVYSNTLPNINPINNSAYITYEDDTPNVTKNTSTNIVSTTIVSLTSITKKYVNNDLVPLFATLTYTITVENTGNIDMLTPTIIDTLPHGVTYIDGTLTNATGNPNSSIILQTISPKNISTITFKVIVSTIPKPNPLINTGNLIYTYKVNPNDQTSLSGSQLSNSVSTLVGFSNVSSTKSVDLSHVIVGETVTYTILLSNSGAGTASSVIFIDTIPEEFTFIENTFTVNGSPSPYSYTDFVQAAIPNIPPNGIIPITFKAFANTIPEFNPINNLATATFTDDSKLTKSTVTNIASTTIAMAVLSSAKFVNKEFIGLNTTISYSVVLSNSGNVPANNVILIDTLPQPTTYIQSSMKQDNQPVTSITDSIIAYLPSSVEPYSSSTITFNVFIDTIPTINPLINNAYIPYSYTSNPSNINSYSSSTSTNNVSTLLLVATVTSKKYTDKVYADCGELITYTLVFTNSGNATATNVFFVDTIPDGTILVNYTVYLNGTLLPDVSPELGLNIPSISPYSSSTITYKVKVIC